jgi:hypothetical protein
MIREDCSKKWTYPFDWTEKKQQEIEKVKTLMEVVEGVAVPKN